MEIPVELILIIENAKILEKMKYKIFITLLIAALFSCKNDKEVIPEKDYWKPFTEIQYDAKNASYCYSDGEILLIRSLESYALFDSNHNLKQRYGYLPNKTYGYNIFPLVNNIFISIINQPNPRLIEFYNIKNTNIYGAIRLEEDSNIISIDNHDMGIFEPAYIGSPSGYYIFKVIDKSNPDFTSFAIVNLKINGLYSIKRVPLPFIHSNIKLHFYDAGKFYFTDQDNNDRSLYTMDSTGSYEKIANIDFVRMTKINNIMYGITSYWQLYLSLDNGHTWTKSTVSMPTLNLIELNKMAIYYKGSSIAQLLIEGTNIKGITYNSKGLEGNEITYMCKHNDRYYCTTKSGVFYIEEKYFKPI